MKAAITLFRILAVDALPFRPNHTTEGNKFSYTVLSLPVFMVFCYEKFEM